MIQLVLQAHKKVLQSSKWELQKYISVKKLHAVIIAEDASNVWKIQAAVGKIHLVSIGLLADVAKTYRCFDL